MSLPVKPGEKAQSDMDMAVVRRQLNGRGVVQQISRPYSVHGQMNEYHSVDPNYSAHMEMAAQNSPDKDIWNNSHRAHQNAEAILKYNKEDKGKVREGRHAAAVDQIHQNDLHNIERVSDVAQSKENGATVNGMVVAVPDRSKNYSKTQLDRSQQKLGPRSQNRIDLDSELTRSFDPMKDRHMWAMWRTAVNGRIVDEVRRLERIKSEKGPASGDSSTSGVHGRALVVPPLKQFIKFESDESQALVQQMSNLGQGSLQSSQFVYFGLPRVRMPQPKK